MCDSFCEEGLWFTSCGRQEERRKSNIKCWNDDDSPRWEKKLGTSGKNLLCNYFWICASNSSLCLPLQSVTGLSQCSTFVRTNLGKSCVFAKALVVLCWVLQWAKHLIGDSVWTFTVHQGSRGMKEAWWLEDIHLFSSQSSAKCQWRIWDEN